MWSLGSYFLWKARKINLKYPKTEIETSTTGRTGGTPVLIGEGFGTSETLVLLDLWLKK